MKRKEVDLQQVYNETLLAICQERKVIKIFSKVLQPYRHLLIQKMYIHIGEFGNKLNSNYVNRV